MVKPYTYSHKTVNILHIGLLSHPVAKCLESIKSTCATSGPRGRESSLCEGGQGLSIHKLNVIPPEIKSDGTAIVSSGGHVVSTAVGALSDATAELSCSGGTWATSHRYLSGHCGLVSASIPGAVHLIVVDALGGSALGNVADGLKLGGALVAEQAAAVLDAVHKFTPGITRWDTSAVFVGVDTAHGRGRGLEARAGLHLAKFASFRQRVRPVPSDPAQRLIFAAATGPAGTAAPPAPLGPVARRHRGTQGQGRGTTRRRAQIQRRRPPRGPPPQAPRTGQAPQPLPLPPPPAPLQSPETLVCTGSASPP